MKFHAVLLYIDDQFPDISIFRKLQEVGRGLYPKGAYLYSVEQKLIADRFYWMYFQYDNAKLYSDKVIDTEDNSVKENPRPKSQVEPRLQLFSCYDLERHILYVSDYSKKATITDYISEMLQKSAQTKNVLRSVDDFLNVVTQLKSVCFTQRRTLFTSKEDSIFKKMAATQAHAKSEFTQLGQLVIYFKYASAYAIATIVISSITLLIPADPAEVSKRIFQIIIQCLSSIGFTVYALNLFFLAVILRFMLNRQLWNT